MDCYQVRQDIRQHTSKVPLALAPTGVFPTALAEGKNRSGQQPPVIFYNMQSFHFTYTVLPMILFDIYRMRQKKVAP